ncbi:Pre-mRNA-splicing factor CWC22 [Phytophthora citrophthora]|uniref:Pre-mRNA-splicing factor CWC22 n=1 Tax=Phytophthora citrophthora TaxID=4793 RepID=A0AAD9G1F6_9STRA|nr:Pre-mRNA-splicing factor CWC22 [Phytophthora citrophthora]
MARRSPSRSRSRSRPRRSRRRARSASTSSSASSRSRSRSASPPRKKSRRRAVSSPRRRSKDRDATPPRPSKGDSTPPRPPKDDVKPPKDEDATPSREQIKKDLSAQEDTKPRRRPFLVDARSSGRTGGVYIPPFKLAQMLQQDTDLSPSSEQMQRRTWDALRKSLNGLINKVNVANLSNILPELFQENLVRARGLLARAIMKAQLASPGFTHIYAALVAVINTKMPENGELLVKRVVYRFRRAFKRGDKVVAIALVRFIAHLVNQQVVHELLALEVLTLLLANPTDDSVEVAVNFTKECGQILAELCPEGLRAIFERFRGILHEGEIDKRVQYTIEGLFAIRKGGFADYPAVYEQLDLVESGDQITHETTLEEKIDCEDKLDVFRIDPDYEKNEQMWAAIKKEILGESDSDSDSASGSDDDGDDEEDEETEQQASADNSMAIQDYTEQDLVNLRRTIYLTIMSSITHEECAHKLMKLNIRPGQEKEICSMLIECCSQERTYLRYYGLLSERFCLIKREYQDAFDECFAEQYSLIHRLETNKLRNVAKLFAHLLFTDALPWTVFEYIRLNEEETTSSSRIFIKILCQELSEHLGMKTLKERFLDDIMQPTFAGLFPKDNPRNTRFAINFFTSIGLGGLTTGLREYLKNAPKMIMEQAKAAADSSDSDSDSDSSDSSSSSGSSSGSDSDSDSDSSSDSSDSD